MLEARELSAGYRKTPVLKGISFSIFPGEIVSLIGPNGAGKSTLLKTAAGLLPPLGGDLLLMGKRLSVRKEEERAKLLAVLWTERFRSEWLTCEEVVSMGRYPYTGRFGVLSAADRKKTEEAMALGGVTELKDRLFHEISDGQRQRVMLSRVICQETPLLILDEPAAFLDIRYELELLRLLRQCAKERGCAVLLSLHELSLARALSDRLICLKEGRIDRVGTAEEIFSGRTIAALYGAEDNALKEVFPYAFG